MVAVIWAFAYSFAAADILFCGLTENGWQIFRCDDEGGALIQLTDSIGDKRCPRIDRSNGVAYFRDSGGKIKKLGDLDSLSSGKTHDLAFPRDEVSDYCVASGAFYFNRLVTGNAQRRFIWKWERSGENSEGAETLLLRKDSGSLRQVRISPSGSYGVATFLWRRGEERLGIFELTKESTSADGWKFLTDEFTVSAFPCWYDDEWILYSGKVEEGNFDLFRVSRNTGLREPVVESETASEFSPAVGGGNIFFERSFHDTPGSALICRKSLRGGRTFSLDIPIPAKEPCWFDGGELSQ